MRYKCYACGEAENTDLHCTLDIEIGEPCFCPVSNEEAEWFERPEKVEESQ